MTKPFSEMTIAEIMEDVDIVTDDRLETLITQGIRNAVREYKREMKAQTR